MCAAACCMLRMQDEVWRLYLSGWRSDGQHAGTLLPTSGTLPDVWQRKEEQLDLSALGAPGPNEIWADMDG